MDNNNELAQTRRLAKSLKSLLELDEDESTDVIPLIKDLLVDSLLNYKDVILNSNEQTANYRVCSINHNDELLKMSTSIEQEYASQFLEDLLDELLEHTEE